MPNQQHPKIGDHVLIANLDRSHARSRAKEGLLLGRSGRVVTLLLSGSYLMVELFGDLPHGLHGTRRWVIHPDDLMINPDMGGNEPTGELADIRPDVLATGISGTGEDLVRHAMKRPGPPTGLCGELVRPVVIGDWSPKFDPTIGRTCPECIRIGARGDDAGKSIPTQGT